MFEKLVKRFVQPPLPSHILTKKQYVLHLLEQGHYVSQLGLYNICQKQGVLNLYTTRLSGVIFNLRKDGYRIQNLKRKKGKITYVEYYLD